jgi:hypothetical protein
MDPLIVTQRSSGPADDEMCQRFQRLASAPDWAAAASG